MVPELIATDEFEDNEIEDETGDQQVLLSSKNSYDKQYPVHRFQTYK